MDPDTEPVRVVVCWLIWV